MPRHVIGRHLQGPARKPGASLYTYTLVSLSLRCLYWLSLSLVFRLCHGRTAIISTNEESNALDDAAGNIWQAGPGPHRMHLGSARAASVSTGSQGLTLVHFSAQRKRFLWDRGAFRGFVGGV